MTIGLRAPHARDEDRPAPPAAGATRTSTARPQRRLSPLTLRILAVNLIAPLMLLAGLLYLDQYEDALIAAELEALRVQADLIAAALGEGAVTAETATFENLRVPVTNHRLVPEQARSMVRRLAEMGDVRARLFDPNGLLVADSRRLIGPGGAVQVFDLAPPPEPMSVVAWLRGAYDWSKRVLGWGKPLPRYMERREQTASDYDEVVDAIEVGVPALALRRLAGDGRRILSAAVPVQYYKHVVGAVMVSRPDDRIEQSLFEVRLAIGQLFLGIAMVTVALSFYLARAISRPVRRLAAAAEAVRSGQGRATIPDLSGRQDEIGDLSASLRSMTEALWQRMDAIERFAADVAHEIKNPLTSLRSAVETVVRLEDPAKQKRLLAILQDDVARLDRLISDISDASRLDAELSRAHSQTVPLRPVLETLAEVYRPAAEEHEVSLRLALPEGDTSLPVAGMEDRLVQVTRNLIANALSFSPPGGTVTLGGRMAGGMVELTISDDGPGIPAGKEEAIFDRFYSERPQGEKFGTHSGLGLSISRQIVEAHGGAITATNRIDAEGAVCGAVFTIRLPAA